MKTLKTLLLATAVLSMAAIGLQAQPGPYSYAPQQPNFYRSDTNAFPLTLTSSVTYSNLTAGGTNSLKQTVRQDKGLSLFPTITVYNTGGAITGGATNLTFAFTVTPDGTHYVTPAPLIMTVPLIVPASPVVGTGMAFDPASGEFALRKGDVGVNYLLTATKA